MSRIGGGSKRRRRFVGVGGRARPSRPVRWIEGNSAHGGEPLPVVSAFPFSPSLDTSLWPTAGGTELIFGDDDLDWMDKNEATIERVVGDITVACSFLASDLENIQANVFYRLGLLVVEEVEDISTWVPPSLWDRESVEEYEWMWLLQDAVDLFQRDTTVSPMRFFSETKTHHLDSHIHRKLGKKDHLVLLGQFGLGVPLVGDLVIGAVHLVRVLFKV